MVGAGAQMYKSVLFRLFPSLRGRSRRGRLAAALVFGLVAALALAVAPVIIAVGTRTGISGALFALILEGLTIAVLASLAYTRRVALAASRVAQTSGKNLIQAREINAKVRAISTVVDRMEERSRRQGQRSVETRKAVSDIHRLLRNVSRAQPVLAELAATELRLQASNDDAVRQHQAVLNLFSLITTKAAVPPLGGWAASPDLTLMLVDELLRIRPSTVVECGSGVTTLFMALAVAQYDLPTKIIALEHEEVFMAGTRDMLARHGVSGYAEVRHAPLRPTSVPDHRPPWYDEDSLRAIEDVGLLFVDGPPQTAGSRARKPAVPLLRDHFAAVCTIFLDDLRRPDELAVADEWSAMLPDFRREDLDLQKGAAVLRRG